MSGLGDQTNSRLRRKLVLFREIECVPKMCCSFRVGPPSCYFFPGLLPSFGRLFNCTCVLKMMRNGCWPGWRRQIVQRIGGSLMQLLARRP
jgi:hypothetical protein